MCCLELPNGDACDDAPVFALVLSKPRDGRDHDRSGAKPRFMDCNLGKCLDLGLAPTGSLRRCSRNYREGQSFHLGDRRSLPRGQSVAPLSWGNCAELWARDTPSLERFREKSKGLFDGKMLIAFALRRRHVSLQHGITVIRNTGHTRSG
jgi:hypothetical protein